MKQIHFLGALLLLTFGQAICWLTSQTVMSTCLLVLQFLLLVAITVYYLIQKRKPTPKKKPEHAPTPAEWLGLTLMDNPSLSVLLKRLQAIASNPKALEPIKAELFASHQSFLWISRMKALFYPRWKTQFEDRTMPVDLDDEHTVSSMRSLLYEIALHTMDYARFRSGDINLQRRHQVNPAAILLQRSWSDLPVKPFSDDPIQVPRDVRCLAQLIRHDGVQLVNASIMGYQIADEENSNDKTLQS